MRLRERKRAGLQLTLVVLNGALARARHVARVKLRKRWV